MALSKKLRFEVFKRDGFACQYCGRTPPSAILEVDHFIAVSAGGSDSEDNLLTACFDCNRGKGARPATIGPRESLADREAQIRESEEQIKAYRAALRSQQRRQARAVKAVEKAFTAMTEGGTFTNHGRTSIEVWLRSWTQEDLTEAFRIALHKFPCGHPSLFAYVGGILRRWKKQGGRIIVP